MEFKYELKRMNVVKVTNDKDTKDKYIAQGFELIEKKKSEKPKEDVKVEEKPKK
ncbi:hypothetical protein [Clostridium sp.]|uniref:hypothetical protein n=1 Tax=Clostridium sp. TaxID=1506 RepID=UPI003216D5C0